MSTRAPLMSRAARRAGRFPCRCCPTPRSGPARRAQRAAERAAVAREYRADVGRR